MDIRNLVDEKMAELKAQPSNVLRKLEPYRVETIPVSKRRVAKLAIWREEAASGETKVIVQCYRPYLLGIGRMMVRGFVIDGSGAVRDLQQDQLYEFT